MRKLTENQKILFREFQKIAVEKNRANNLLDTVFVGFSDSCI